MSKYLVIDNYGEQRIVEAEANYDFYMEEKYVCVIKLDENIIKELKEE